MTNPTKATRATINLGDIELDGYQMPDGQKAMSRTGLEVLGILTRDSTGKKYAQPLLLKDNLSRELTKIEGQNASAKLISLDTFSAIVVAYAQLGNKKCQAVVFACFAESLERRLDAAFGVLRTEEERNERFIARKDSILQRHFWTDTVKWYIDSHPELSDNARKFLYANVSNCLNRELFGMSAKEIRAMLDMDASENVRDCIAPSLLPDVTFVEKYAATRVRQGLEPMQAIREAVVFCNFPKRSPKTGLELKE